MEEIILKIQQDIEEVFRNDSKPFTHTRIIKDPIIIDITNKKYNEEMKFKPRNVKLKVGETYKYYMPHIIIDMEGNEREYLNMKILDIFYHKGLKQNLCEVEIEGKKSENYEDEKELAKILGVM